MFKIAICDDSQSYIKYIKNLILQISPGNMEIYEYTSGKRLIEDARRMHNIIILDIQLKDYNGNYVAQKIRVVNKEAVLVLCSGVMQPTPKAFEVDAYRYILKSEPEVKTIKVLKEAFDEAERRFTQEIMMVELEDSYVTVKIDSIMYISKLKRKSEIHIAPGRSYYGEGQLTSRIHLNMLYERLKDYGFEYAHSSYIVNYRWVSELMKDNLRLYDGTILTVSRNKKRQFAERLATSLAGKYN